MNDETIEGITLEQVAKAAVLMHARNEAEWDTIAQAHGFPPGRYAQIAEAWTAKMQTDPSLAIAYNDAYQRGMVEAGITAPDVTLEQYADMLRTGGPSEENLAKWGLTMQQFSMISHRWTQAMGADVGLAQRFASLMAPGMA